MSTPQPVNGPRNSEQLSPLQKSARLVEQHPYSEKDYPSTANVECDAYVALVRGLAEHLEGRSMEMDGDTYSIKRAHYEWADPAEQANWPSISIVPIGRGRYDASNFKPNVRQKPIVEGGNEYLVKFGEFVQQVGIDVWAKNPTERAVLKSLVEQELNPVEWMYGFRLHLPFYYGQIARYELVDNEHEDDESAAMRKQRNTMLVVNASVSFVKVGRFVRAKRPEARFEFSEGAPSR